MLQRKIVPVLDSDDVEKANKKAQRAENRRMTKRMGTLASMRLIVKQDDRILKFLNKNIEESYLTFFAAYQAQSAVKFKFGCAICSIWLVIDFVEALIQSSTLSPAWIAVSGMNLLCMVVLTALACTKNYLAKMSRQVWLIAMVLCIVSVIFEFELSVASEASISSSGESFRLSCVPLDNINCGTLYPPAAIALFKMSQTSIITILFNAPYINMSISTLVCLLAAISMSLIKGGAVPFILLSWGIVLLIILCYIAYTLEFRLRKRFILGYNTIDKIDQLKQGHNSNSADSNETTAADDIGLTPAERISRKLKNIRDKFTMQRALEQGYEDEDSAGDFELSPGEKEIDAITDLIASKDLWSPVVNSADELEVLANEDEDTVRWLKGLERGSVVNVPTADQIKKEVKLRNKQRSRAVSTGWREMGSLAFDLDSASPDEIELHNMLVALPWDLDIFRLQELASNDAIYCVMQCIFNRYGFFKKYNIKHTVLEKMCSMLAEGYNATGNQYHNHLHGADVLNSSHYLLCHWDLGKQISEIEFFALLVAAAIHDYKHPGLTNAYLVATHNDLAILYNDDCVLENHHIAQFFFLMKDDSCNILKDIPKESMPLLRSTLIYLVLATDLKQHFQIVAHLKTATVEDADLLDVGDDNDTSSIHSGGSTVTAPSKLNIKFAPNKEVILKACIKIADLGNVGKPTGLYLKWTSILMEEFWSQGDKERERGLPISAFMDRDNKNLKQCQLGFFKFICLPFYGAVAAAIPPANSILAQVQQNYSLWTDELATDDDPAPWKSLPAIEFRKYSLKSRFVSPVPEDANTAFSRQDTNSDIM